MKNYLFLGLILFTLLFFSSCSNTGEVVPTQLPEISIGDGGFLSGEPCTEPCFFGIYPGTTTEKEALSILDPLGDIDHCEKWEKVENGIPQGIGCQNIRIFFNEDNLVSIISFSPSSIITVGEIINKYGTPDSVSVVTEGVNGEGPVHMALNYDGLFFLGNLVIQESSPFQVNSNTQIINVVYFYTTDPQNSILNEPWKGYESY